MPPSSSARRPTTAQVRSVQLVPLQPRVLLLVVACCRTARSRRTSSSSTTTSTTPGSVPQPRRSTRQLVGAIVDVAPRRSRRPAIPTSTPSSRAARTVLRQRAGGDPEPLFVGGASRLAAEQSAFATSERAARLLEMLEHQVVVVSLVRELLDRGLTVSIGTENALDELRDCSIVRRALRRRRDDRRSRSVCSARRGWTTGTRSPRCRPCRSSSGVTSREPRLLRRPRRRAQRDRRRDQARVP